MVAEMGKLEEPFKIQGRVIVCAEVIPSWLLLTNSWDASTTYLYVEDECRWFRRSLERVGKMIVSLEWRMFWESEWTILEDSERTVFIQGSYDFCVKVLDKLKEVMGVKVDKVVVAMDGGRRKGPVLSWKLDWYVVPHSKVGGVLSSRFYVGAWPSLPRTDREGFKARLEEGSVQRTLPDLLCFVVGGTSVPSPTVDTRQTRIPLFANNLLNKFVVPSAFSRSGWVERHLVPKEVGAALDLPPGAIAELEKLGSEGTETFDRFVCLPPVKVIQAAGFLCTRGQLGHSKRLALPADDFGEKVPLTLSTFSPDEVEVEVEELHAKAVKADASKTNTGMWDDEAMLEGFKYQPTVFGPMFKRLRYVMLERFKTIVRSSFSDYLEANYSSDELSDVRGGRSEENSEIFRDWTVGNDAVGRAERSSFWDWDGGSTAFFWRWQPEVKGDMRDGTRLFLKGELPSFRKKQRLNGDLSVRELVKLKIDKVRARAYIAAGLVLSLSSFFHVPKGDEDIRIVYDLTACGLNEALWAPSFWMPTIMSVLNCATHSSWFGDVDAGEMFHNYPLEERIRPYAGVDITWMDPSIGTRWERWTRMAMGMLPSPWVTTRLFAWASEIIRGDRYCENNPFRWSRVVLNIPGMSSYNPAMPRFYKWSDSTNAIACDFKTFVDDSRTIGPTRQLAHAATHRIEYMMGYLGLQDATRKRRPTSQRPGEWTGSMSIAIEGVGLFATVSQAKWDKAKGYVNELLEVFADAEDLPDFDLKDLERKAGFLVHLSMTYPLLSPFMRGFYLTMNTWREGRDQDGWKMTSRMWRSCLANSRRNGEAWSAIEEARDRPTLVKAAPMFSSHLHAMQRLFGSSKPTLRLIRGTSIYEVCYMFGDASGVGFGSSWTKGATLVYRFGVWGMEGTDTSSNYRELRNLVDTLETMGKDGDLAGKEVFVFTDNMVSEAVSAKGSSKSKLLFDLVVRLYTLEMCYRCNIQLVHVAGTRMIEQGTDGLSRGDMYDGVMRGESMLKYIPLHLNALERSPGLEDWLGSWAGDFRGREMEILAPEDWLERGHDFWGSRRNCDNMWIPAYKCGSMVWVPPPGVARFAIEELRQARQKRQASLHIFVVPRLMGPEWRRNVFKSADLMFEVPVGHPIWPTEMHEPLTIAIFFPYLNRWPWELRRTKLMVEVGRQVQRLLKDDPPAARNLLSELFKLTGRMDSMQIRELRRVLSGLRISGVPSKSGIQR